MKSHPAVSPSPPPPPPSNSFPRLTSLSLSHSFACPPPPPLLLASGRERWAITQQASFFRLSATCYANIINQWSPDCLRSDWTDVSVPAVHRYLLFFLFSFPFPRTKKKKSSFAKAPQDGRLNDGHRSFSNKFHGA